VILLSTRRGPRKAPRLTRALLMAIAPLGLAACGLLEPRRCGVPQRDLSVSGQLSEGTPPRTVLFAQFDLVERQEEGGVEVVLSWGILSASLKPHVTAAELRDASDGSLIAALPLDPRTGVEMISFGGGPYTWDVPVADLRALLAAGRGRVELTTTLPDQSVVHVDLSTVRDSRTFERAYCD
jgi:hypothetical protein